jgi:electron transfer flavoprotein alpha subunit
MDILVVLEDLNGKIHRLGLEALVGAQKLSEKQNLNISALVIGSNADELASMASQYDIDKVLKVTNDLVSNYSSDGYTEVVRQVIERESPKYIFFGHTYQVRDYVPKLSAKLMKPFLADSISFEVNADSVVSTKQVYNAKLLSDITTLQNPPYLVSFQSATFNSDNIKPGTAQIEEYDVPFDSSLIRTQAEEPFKESVEDLDLTSAELIVSVGRGIGKEENIPLAKDLATTIGADLSSSRPVVDSGWLPSVHQVGSSGQSVAPKMYLALGISGAIQHVVGMKASKKIVAINKDPDAPIFELADYGVVGDLLEILPKLNEALK